MEVQLKELIERIKSEGIESAEEQAKQIIGAAEKKASEIILKAKEDAKEIAAKAENAAANSERAGIEALKQAGRDLILNVQARIIDLFKAIVIRETGSALSEKVMVEIILTVVKKWTDKGIDELQVLISSQQGKKLEDHLMSKLAADFKKGVEILPLPGSAAGFRISEKNGSAYYDFTDRGIAELLIEYLNPRIAGYISEAVSKKQ
ncbi:MAG: V-type ATP synthase subunit E [Spirochaeta sp.]|nr:V-type ATP synthase subunit E [Spirochaeta sp.]